MLLKIALLLSMLIQLGATITAITLIRRTRYNISWILISTGLVLMAVRRLFDFSTLFWQSQIFSRETVNIWLGILISVLMFVGVIFIRQIFNLQERIERIRKTSESRVLSAVIQAEEKARQKFARDLHDGLGPVLSSVKMTMSAIDVEKLDPKNKQIFEHSCQSIDHAIVTLREISNDLSPHLLKNFGLIRAIETSAGQLLKNSTVDFSIHSGTGEKRYAYDIEISLYRIISELINNSIRHANPKVISLVLEEEAGILGMRYRDDGSGFQLGTEENLKLTGGMGLENIRSRIKSLNGQFYLDTAPGKGLFIHVMIPLS